MEHITAAGNTEVPACLTLSQAGCRVDRQGAAELRVSGSSNLEILGLLYMREKRRSNWKAQHSEIDAFLERFYPDTSEPK